MAFGKKNIFEMINAPYILLLWFLAMFVSLWYVFSGLQTGLVYSIMGLLTPTTLFMILFFVRQSELANIVPFPFKTNNAWASTFLYIAGFWVGFFGGLIGLIQYFLSPLALYTQTAYATFVTVGGALGNFINIGILPPPTEEFWWASVFLVSFIGTYFIIKLLGGNPKNLSNKIIMWVSSLIIAMGTFAAFHSFNPTYTTTKQYLTAAGFRGIVIIVGFGLSVLEFFIGLHLSNNLSSLVLQPNGVNLFLTALLTTWFGIMFLIVFIIIPTGIAVYGLRNNKFKLGDLIKRV